MDTPPAASPSLRWVAGEVQAKTTTSRSLLPSLSLTSWPPFSRVVETIATQTRQLPVHGHEREEVLTYVFEGFASYQFQDQAPIPAPSGSVQLLTAPAKTIHRVSPVEGGTVRWFSVVVTLPSSVQGAAKLQSVQTRPSDLQPDGTVVRELVGPGSGVSARSELTVREIQFAAGGTTFQRIGHGRRGIVYALSGRGSVDSQPIEGGEGVLAEGVAGIAIHGNVGLRVVVVSVPAPP
jgi:redox-sensitive bicupin YhaK (pirin superfamily)